MPGANVEDDRTPGQRLSDLGLAPIDLPVFGSFEPIVQLGDILYTMGHWPLRGSEPVTGKLGAELSLDDGRSAAELAALALIGSLANHLGDLGRIDRIASVTVTVNATPTFAAHTAVADAASDLLVSVFGGRGRHTRLAIGVSSLPADLALELTAIVRVESTDAQS